MEINIDILIKNFFNNNNKGVHRLVSYVQEYIPWISTEGAFICYPVAGIFFLIFSSIKELQVYHEQNMNMEGLEFNRFTFVTK